MSEAPERIWAYAGAFRMWREKYPEHVKSPVEYIRADHVAEMLKAEREKALREAAAVCAETPSVTGHLLGPCILDLISEDQTNG